MKYHECEYCAYRRHGYCIKIDGIINNYGCCERSEPIVSKSYRNPRSLNGYKRKVKYKQYLERLADESRSYPCGAYRVSYDRSYTDNPDDTLYIRREYRGQRSAYLKNQSNRKIRRYRGDISSGCGYRKIYDYWWELT